MKKKVVALCLVSMMLTSLVGCGQTEQEKKEETSTTPVSVSSKEEAAEPSEEVQEPLVIDWLLFDTPQFQDIFEQSQKDSATYQYICETNNIELVPTGLATDQVQIRIVGGDLGDLISVYNVEELNALIESDSIYSLNELIEEYAPDIPESHEGRWQAALELAGTDDGQVYALPVNAGNSGWDYTNGRYLYTVRWDLYKELGYPEIKDQYDLLDVLEDMVALQPTTPEGKKVYGTGFALSATHYWRFVGPFYSTFGYKANGSDFLFVDIDDNERLLYGAYDGDSPFYIAAEYYNKAYRKGILDPDSFTMTGGDLDAKSNAGEVLTTLYYNQTYENQLLENDPESIVGWAAIPVKDAWLWQADETLGWNAGYALAIPKTCEDPARVMEFLGWCFSEDGSRVLTSGVEGVNWEYDDNGTPVFTEETAAIFNAGGDDVMNLGFGQQPLTNLCGYYSGTKHSDGFAMDLKKESAFLSLREMSPCQKDYCEYYDSAWPNEHMIKRVENGEMNALSNRTQIGTFAAPTEDISRIDSACMQISLEAIPKLVQAADDAEYEKIKAETIAKMKDAGAEEAKKFYADYYASTLKPLK